MFSTIFNNLESSAVHHNESAPFLVEKALMRKEDGPAGEAQARGGDADFQPYLVVRAQVRVLWRSLRL